jgi:pimeloyl-ACP methyl ester carboxylesterase
VSTGLPEAYAAVYANSLGTPSALGAALNWHRASTRRGGRLSTVGAVTVPTTYVWGTADVAVGAGAAKAMAADITGPYRFVVLDGAGLRLPETHPDVADLILKRTASVASL